MCCSNILKCDAASVMQHTAQLRAEDSGKEAALRRRPVRVVLVLSSLLPGAMAMYRGLATFISDVRACA